MQIKDYVASILDVISLCPFAESQSLAFEERPPDAAYIYGTVVFVDASKLHFKEFVFFTSDGSTILKYGYNYLTKDGSLIFRYDNALDPKVRQFPTYPEHKHTPEELLPARRPEFLKLLKEIEMDQQHKFSDRG